MDMLCLMFFSEERGVLITGDKPWTDEEVAGAIRGDHTANLRDIQLLLEKGVAVRDSRGAIFSKRMVRDEQQRQKDKSRQRKSRSCHGDVTPLSENETVNKVAIDPKEINPSEVCMLIMRECSLSGTHFKESILKQLTSAFERGQPLEPTADEMMRAIRLYRELGGDKLYLWFCDGGWQTDESQWFGKKRQSAQRVRSDGNKAVILDAIRIARGDANVPDGRECQGGTRSASTGRVLSRTSGASAGSN